MSDDPITKGRLMRTATLIDILLEQTTGLEMVDRRIVAYYTLSTHCIERVNTFPLLVLMGSMGTGKSQTLRVIKHFAYRPNSFSLRGRTLPTIRDELANCQNGTAIIEESDRAWRGSELFEALLSDRYQRPTAEAALKEKHGDNFTTRDIQYFGATVLHRRISFGDPALDGRSIFIHFRANHKRTYREFEENDPLAVEGRELVKDLTFESPEITRPSGVAGRIFDSHKLLLATAQFCGDEIFMDLIAERLQFETTQLKEAQSLEPAGMVLQALIEGLSAGNGKLMIRYVRIRDLRTSIWNSHHVEMQPHQVAVIARNLGFETKNSHGVTVVVPTAAKLVLACENLGYEDDAISALRKDLLGRPREPGDDG